ncbi:MAG: HAMP domain-containing histidine kinase [Lachnospiraceae bacterium]|nr:HAMP domain-containing histidine kinase [Lachnospiraceae bacterium]
MQKEKREEKKRKKGFRERLRGLKSMRLRLFLSIFAIGVVITVVVALTVRAYHFDRTVSTKVTQVRDYATKLSNKIVANALFASGADETDIDGEISTVSELFQGRIILVNGSLKIIKDTFGAENGKTLISAEAIRAMSGETNQYVDRENRYIELTIPVKDMSVETDKGETRESDTVQGAIIMTFSTSDIYEVQSAVDQRIVFLATVFGLILVVFAYFFSGVLTRPLKKLSSSIAHVADGYMDDKVNVTAYREIEDISDSLNSMLDRMKKMEDSRQEFVSNVSHELKTPMTSIKVLADSLLSQGDAPAELYREFLSDINDEIDRENKIITDLLALVKLDKRNEDLNVEEVSVNELLEVILKRIKPIAKQRNIELIFESYRPVTAEVDGVKISLALSNLIENAVKYNRDSGWVHVSLNADHKYFFVKVSDSGIGIPEEAQSLIFERFYRVDKTRSRETGGTGLGLAITKSVVLMHNGSVKVYSTPEEGTTFTVRIPLSFIPEQSE